MTCEVAVMNKSAVALAADSAATLAIQTAIQTVHKIYIVNKLFALSEDQPVGIMIYGKPDLLGVPWETIIEMYRGHLATKNYFGTLTEYSQELISFIESANVLFPEAVQRSYFRDCLLIYYNQICKDIIEKVKAYTKKKKITKLKTKEIVESVITKHCQQFEKQNKIPNVSNAWVRKLLTKYASTITEVKNEVFVKLPISATASNNLKKITGYLFSRDVFREDFSGVVIAGFGNDEIFPHVKSFEIEGVVNGKAKYKSGREGETGQDNNSYIIPFAQGDMVRAFMEGIHPMYYGHVFRGPKYLLKALGSILPEIEEIKDLGKEKLKSVISKIEEVKKGILDEYLKTLSQYMQEEHVGPIMNAVSHLPKQELAEMAESLVRLVAFKRRMSVREVESVGGPIDVAVISKADGFVWIKRKRYFEQELNPQLSGS